MPRQDFIQRAGAYLAQVAAMAGEAARSNDPEVVHLALALIDRQPETARELLLLEAQPEPTKREIDLFLDWLEGWRG